MTTKVGEPTTRYPFHAALDMITGVRPRSNAATSSRLSVVGSGVTITTAWPTLVASSDHQGRHARQLEVRNASSTQPAPTSATAGAPAGETPATGAAGQGPAAPSVAGRARLERRSRTGERYPRSTEVAQACKSLDVRIGVIGATGPAGQAVAVQFAAIGIEVVVGSRSEERAAETVEALEQRWEGRELPLVAGTNEVAAGAELIVVATPWEGVLGTVADLTTALDGKIVVSMVNALTRWGKHMIPLLPPTGSVAVALANALPGSRIVGAFHHLPAGPWADLDHQLDADVLVCADDRAAAREVIALIDRLPGLRGVDTGGLGSALALEALTAALIEVNRRYKTHVALRLTGLDGAP
jgi:NADPH-dependent F420 reductase